MYISRGGRFFFFWMWMSWMWMSKLTFTFTIQHSFSFWLLLKTALIQNQQFSCYWFFLVKCNIHIQHSTFFARQVIWHSTFNIQHSIDFLTFLHYLSTDIMVNLFETPPVGFHYHGQLPKINPASGAPSKLARFIEDDKVNRKIKYVDLFCKYKEDIAGKPQVTCLCCLKGSMAQT